MSFTVVRESVDYLWVISRQIDRCAELGTKFWQPDQASARDRLKAFIGCVWQLYYLSMPVVKRSKLPDYSETLAKLLEAKEHRGMLVAVWNDVNKVFATIVKALDHEQLLVRVSGLGQVA